jgi:hypothetical protein
MVLQERSENYCFIFVFIKVSCLWYNMSLKGEDAHVLHGHFSCDFIIIDSDVSFVWLIYLYGDICDAKIDCRKELHDDVECRSFVLIVSFSHLTDALLRLDVMSWFINWNSNNLIRTHYMLDTTTRHIGASAAKPLACSALYIASERSCRESTDM